MLHAQHKTTPGGAIELGQHQAGDAGLFQKRFCLGDTVLPGGRVEHQQHFGDRLEFFDHPTDFFQLVHQTGFGVEAPGGVNQDNVDAFGLGFGDGLIRHRRRVLTVRVGPDNIHSCALSPVRQLIDRSRAKRIGSGDHHTAACFGEKPRKFANRGRFSHPIHPDHKHHRGAFRQPQGGVILGQHRFNALGEEIFHLRGLREPNPLGFGSGARHQLVGGVRTGISQKQGVVEFFPGGLVQSLFLPEAPKGFSQRPGSHRT